MPEIKQVTLTLIYLDNTRFIIGGFKDEAAALAWIAEEQAKPQWQQGTTWEIV